MKQRTFVLLAFVALLLMAVCSAALAAQNHITATLKPVNGSKVHGSVDLTQLSGSGTHIDVTARGLKPKHKYLSLYYDNHTCALEPYSKDDIIGRYTANRHGVGRTSGDVKDNLDMINSVSVRRASDFALLACADVHP
jgi:hypothetical protein